MTDDQLREVIASARPQMPPALDFGVQMIGHNIGALRSQARKWAQQFDDFKSDMDAHPWLKTIIANAMDRVRTKHFGG